MFPIILFSAITLLFLAAGLLIRFKKAYWLISGYLFMTETEKQEFDTHKLGLIVSTFSFLLAGLSAAAGVCFYLEKPTYGLIFLLCVLPAVLFCIVLIQKAQNKKTSGHFLNGMSIFFILIVLFVIGSIYNGGRQNQYSIEDNSLVISGSYGETVPLSAVSKISIVKSLPTKLQKKNGYNWETTLKGSFDSSEGRVRLYVDTAKPPFLELDAGYERIFLNCATEQETNELYAKLRAAVQP